MLDAVDRLQDLEEDDDEDEVGWKFSAPPYSLLHGAQAPHRKWNEKALRCVHTKV